MEFKGDRVPFDALAADSLVRFAVPLSYMPEGFLDRIESVAGDKTRYAMMMVWYDGTDNGDLTEKGWIHDVQ